MKEIIPAIMPTSYEDLQKKAEFVRGIVPLSQIDVMDGKFVQSKSWPYRQAGVANEEHFLAMQTQDEMLPMFDEMDYEIDLMIDEPEKHIDEWLPLGASRLIFHIESIKDADLFWAHDIWKEGARNIGDQKVIEIGLAITPGTPLAAIEPYLDKIDLVQCMGIAHVGYQGQPFDERVLEMINTLRVGHPNLPISVDGGVSTETASELFAAGATRLISGSAIFKSDDPKATIAHLGSL